MLILQLLYFLFQHVSQEFRHAISCFVIKQGQPWRGAGNHKLCSSLVFSFFAVRLSSLALQCDIAYKDTMLQRNNYSD